jgi:hypothetical protein
VKKSRRHVKGFGVWRRLAAWWDEGINGALVDKMFTLREGQIDLQDAELLELLNYPHRGRYDSDDRGDDIVSVTLDLTGLFRWRGSRYGYLLLNLLKRFLDGDPALGQIRFFRHPSTSEKKWYLRLPLGAMDYWF